MSAKGPTKIGELLRATRLAARRSVRSVAVDVVKPNGERISHSYITDIEKGRGIPSDHICRQLARVFGKPAGKWIAAAQQSRLARR